MELDSNENSIIKRAAFHSDIWSPAGRSISIAIGLVFLGSGLYNLGNDSFISTYSIYPGYVAAIGFGLLLQAVQNVHEKERSLLLKLVNKNDTADT